MRRANDIETMHQLSSQRGHEKRSATTEQHGEETGKNFTPRFGLTPYNRACGLNCPPVIPSGDEGRETSGAGGFEEGPVEVGEYSYDFTLSLLRSRNIGAFAWLRIIAQAANGMKKIAEGATKTADGRLRLPGDANNSPIDAFKLPIDGLNCRLTPLNCRLSAQTADGKVRLPGDGSAWSVSTSFGPGTEKLKLAARGSWLVVSFSTIKYNNPPLRRIAGTTTNAHFSVPKTMGTGDNNLFPFFLISILALKCEQFSPSGQRGGIVANTNKTSAYET